MPGAGVAFNPPGRKNVIYDKAVLHMISRRNLLPETKQSEVPNGLFLDKRVP